MDEKAKKVSGERKTVTFDAESVEIIQSYRRGQKKIPSFTKAVNELVKKGFGGERRKNE